MDFIGRILWARRMYKRIQIPYVEFLQRDELKNHSIMKKITNDFLMISNGFSIYELLYHRHWFVFYSSRFNSLNHFRYQTLPDVINVMCNPLLIRQNVLRQLYINYDPMIDVILRECELLARYSITMPDLGYKLLLDQNRIRLYYERLKVYRIPQIRQTHSLCRKLPFDILDITEKSFGVIG
jgi:dynein heavy chain